MKKEKVPVGIPTNEEWGKRFKIMNYVNPFLSALPLAVGAAGFQSPELLTVLPLAGFMYQGYSYLQKPRPIFTSKTGEPFINLGTCDNGTPLNIPFDYLKRHTLLLGTTGSGKTTTIRKLLESVMYMGGGATFVDGKSDTTDTYEVFVQIVNECDRMDDFYVLNFLNPYQSNTFNPLLQGDADFCVELCAAFLPQTSGDGAYWQQRGLALMRALMAVLVWLRDNKGKNFSFWDVKEAMNLNAMLEFTKRIENPHNEEERIPMYDKNGTLVGARLISYLNDLGEWRELLKEQPQPQLVDQIIKQHGFAVQQWSSALDLLGGTYSPIFNTHNPDIVMDDIIMNSRLLYVLLPSLGKSEATLKQMGKLILSTVTVSLYRLLGKETVGKTKELFKKVKRNRPALPHVAILDEYGSYAVEGFSTVLAQARSLNYAVVVSAQELGRLMKNKEEGEALVANTNLKIFMKLEDVNTSKIAIERADEEWRLSPGTIRKDSGMVTNKEYIESWSAQQRKRLKILDLAKLRPGQAYFVYEDKLVRFQVPYIKGKPIEYLGLLKPQPFVDIKSLLKVKKELKIITDEEYQQRIKEIEKNYDKQDLKFDKKEELTFKEKMHLMESLLEFILRTGKCYIPLTPFLLLEIFKRFHEYGLKKLFYVLPNKKTPFTSFLEGETNLLDNNDKLELPSKFVYENEYRKICLQYKKLGKKIYKKVHSQISLPGKISAQIEQENEKILKEMNKFL